MPSGFSRARQSEMAAKNIRTTGQCDIDETASLGEGCNFMDVTIKAGAVLEDSVFLKHTIIGVACKIGYHSTFHGTKENPIVIPDGVEIIEGAWINAAELMPFVDYGDGTYSYFATKSGGGYQPVVIKDGRTYKGTMFENRVEGISALTELMQNIEGVRGPSGPDL